VERVRENVSALEGVAAPPRKNGELVFEAPWESRAFGMAVALHGQGLFGWDEFSARLAREIAAHDGTSASSTVLPVAPHAEAEYYERWMDALIGLLHDKGLLSGEDLDARTAEFASGMWDHHGHEHP
jgi:nitrile hydratase accessory protein